MYAKTSSKDIYHLLTEDEERTLCGLRVVGIIVDRPVNTSALHLTSKRPTDRPLCQQCAEVKENEGR
jgi:ribosomal protein L34E